MAAVLPAAAPAWVRDLLRAAPDGELQMHHRGRTALYAALRDHSGGETAVGVIASSECLLPIALHISPRAAPLVVERVSLNAGVLHLDGVPVPVVRIVDMRVPDLSCHAVRGGNPAGTDNPSLVRRLLGLGPGLTPEGDDFLVGWLAACRAFGVRTPRVNAAIARLARLRTTLLSTSMLACAVTGDVPPRLSAWLAVVGSDREGAAAVRLGELGQSSGVAMLRGARSAMRSLARSDASAARSDVSATGTDASAGVAA